MIMFIILTGLAIAGTTAEFNKITVRNLTVLDTFNGTGSSSWNNIDNTTFPASCPTNSAITTLNTTTTCTAYNDITGVLNVTNAGTGDGLFIDQNGDGRGLYIDSEATTEGNNGIRVETFGATAAYFLNTAVASGSVWLARTSNTGSNAATNLFYRSLTAAATAIPVVQIEQDNAGDDQTALQIQQDGSGDAIYVDHNNDTDNALRIISESTDSTIYISGVRNISNFEAVLEIEATNQLTNSQGSLIRALSSNDNSDHTLVYIFDSTQASINPTMAVVVADVNKSSDVLQIVNAGTGDGIWIDQNGDGYALHIDSEATTKAGIYVESGAALEGYFDGDVNISGTVYYGAITANSPILEMTHDPFVAKCTFASNGDFVVSYIKESLGTYTQTIEKVDKNSNNWWHKDCWSKYQKFLKYNDLREDQYYAGQVDVEESYEVPITRDEEQCTENCAWDDQVNDTVCTQDCVTVQVEDTETRTRIVKQDDYKTYSPDDIYYDWGTKTAKVKPGVVKTKVVEI